MGRGRAGSGSGGGSGAGGASAASGAGGIDRDFDAAFARSPGHRENFVSLSSMRSAFPHASRESFDAHVKGLVKSGKYSLDTDEGMVNRGEAHREARLEWAGSKYAWISRK